MRKRKKWNRIKKSKSSHKIKKRIYFLLAFFFGVTGAHYFYEGDYQCGVVCLVIFWLNLVFAIIDGLKFGWYLILCLWVLTVIHACYNLADNFYKNRGKGQSIV